MERLSNIIQKLYQKYLPLLEKKGSKLDLDFPDTTLEIPKNSTLEKNLRKILDEAVKRTVKGEVKITVRPEKITIKDTGTPIPKTTCEKLNSNTLTIKSRVGFGNEITIKIEPLLEKK